MTEVAIEAIVEGERYRSDLGDIKSLAESMTEVGLLHPVVVTSDLRLIAGGRRLAAARSLGWLDIPATVVTNIVEADLILQAESDENTCRKDFTPTEALAIKRAREALLKPIAKERQSEGGRKKASGKLPEAQPRPRDVAARGTGFSASTLRKVEKVQEVAESLATPESVRQVAKAALVEMDRTGKVDRPASAVAKAASAAEPANQILAADEHLQLLSFQAAFARDISRARKGVLAWDAAEVGEKAEPSQLDALDELARSFAEFAVKARQHRSGLKVVNGGRS